MSTWTSRLLRRPSQGSTWNGTGALPTVAPGEHLALRPLWRVGGLLGRATGYVQAMGRVRLALWAVSLVGALAAGYRFVFGLGAATNLSDAWPWGWWIAFDVMGGVALAAGAFVVAAWVHVFGRHRYEVLARPAVLTGFLGYGMVIVGLLMDLGRPYRIWHPMVMWQPHSVMFEVAWCVMIYTTVLALEFSPALWERLGWHRAYRAVRRITVPLVILGVVCSVLHQSSLGSLLLIAPGRVHPLWYTPLLPVLFFVSAMAAGIAMVNVEATLAGRAYRRPVETHLLAGLDRALPWVLGVYGALRIGDWVARGTGPWQVGAGRLEAGMAGVELAMLVLVPVMLLVVPSWRSRNPVRLAACGLVVAGVVVNRLDSALVSMIRAMPVPYLPSWMELAVTAGIVAAGVLAYDAAVRHLPIYREEVASARADRVSEVGHRAEGGVPPAPAAGRPMREPEEVSAA